MILPSTASPILEIDTNRSHTDRPTSMMAMMMTMTMTMTMMGMITMIIDYDAFQTIDYNHPIN